MLSFQPEEEERLAVESARSFAKDRLRPALRKHEAEGVPLEVRREFHALGLCGVDLPADLGFAGGSMMLRAMVEEAVAFGDPGAAFALDGPGAAGWAIAVWGSAEQQRRFLAPLAEDAALRCALAWPCDGEPRVEAREGKLFGTHRGVLAGHAADRVVCLAKDGAYVVERGEFRAEREVQPLGLAEVGVADLVFDGARAERLSSEAAGDELLRRYQIVAAARAVGLSSAAFEHARKYAAERQAFGKPVAHFQAVAFMLADMATELDAARLMVWRAANALDGKTADAPAHVARAADHAREMAAFVTSSAVQVLGGAGYVQDHPVEKWMRDARALAVVAREGGLT
jgi:alkylation response protein AidB-like acyl-CoA dehydrogenase